MWVSLTYSPECRGRQCRNFTLPRGSVKWDQCCYCCYCCCCCGSLQTTQNDIIILWYYGYNHSWNNYGYNHSWNNYGYNHSLNNYGYNHSWNNYGYNHGCFNYGYNHSWNNYGYNHRMRAREYFKWGPGHARPMWQNTRMIVFAQPLGQLNDYLMTNYICQNRFEPRGRQDPEQPSLAITSLYTHCAQGLQQQLFLTLTLTKNKVFSIF